MADTRTERDSMGPMEVPADAYYGASTQRAVLNFPISGLRFPRPFIRVLGLIKMAAARVNAGPRPAGREDVEGDRGGRARSRRRQVRRPLRDRHLPDRLRHLDEHERERGDRQPGERAARRGPRLESGPPERPREHVPVLQRRDPDGASTSPRWWRSSEELIPALEELAGAAARRSRRSSGTSSRPGRTHLQDATPIRLGQEFLGYAGQVERGIKRARRAQEELSEVALGGTAVGTGVNTHPEFAVRVCGGALARSWAYRCARRTTTSRRRTRWTACCRPAASCARSPSACTRSPTTSAGSAPARAPASANSRCRRCSREARSCRAR